MVTPHAQINKPKMQANANAKAIIILEVAGEKEVKVESMCHATSIDFGGRSVRNMAQMRDG